MDVENEREVNKYEKQKYRNDSKNTKSNRVADGYIIVKVIDGEFQVYNYIKDGFSKLDNSDATIFRNKEKALDFVEYLCSKDKTHPVFLTAVVVAD